MLRPVWRRGLAVLILASGWIGIAQAQDSTLWPERERAFFEDGPALLVPQAERDRLLALEPAARRQAIEEFLGRDPLPATPENELLAAIAARQRLAFQDQAAAG